MSSSTEKINSLLQEKLAILISKDIPMDEGLITISYVSCSPDLRHAKVAVSVLPPQKGLTILKRLKKSSSSFSKVLQKETRLRKIPKFYWVLDHTEAEAAKLEELINSLE